MDSAEQIWQGILSRNTAAVDEKKRRILEATIQLMAKDGIEAVTFEAIGHLLKTTKANIKYHFHDKDQLIFMAAKVVVMNAQAVTAQMVERASRPEDKLSAIIDAAYECFHKFPEHMTVWILFVYYARTREEYSKFFVETRSQGQKRMAFLLKALAHGRDLDCEGLAEGIQNILYGQMIGLTGTRKDLKRSKRMSNEIIESFLNSRGIKWSKRRS